MESTKSIMEQYESDMLDLENKRLQNKHLKAGIFQVKYWWLMILINIVVSIVVGLIINHFKK